MTVKPNVPLHDPYRHPASAKPPRVRAEAEIREDLRLQLEAITARWAQWSNSDG